MYHYLQSVVWRRPCLSQVCSPGHPQTHIGGLPDQLNSRKIHLAPQPSAQMFGVWAWEQGGNHHHHGCRCRFSLFHSISLSLSLYKTEAARQCSAAHLMRVNGREGSWRPLCLLIGWPLAYRLLSLSELSQLISGRLAGVSVVSGRESGEPNAGLHWNRW